MKANRSHQLRTGQMKLPIRKIEQVQYVDSKNGLYPILPNEPIVGCNYSYEGINITCIESIDTLPIRCYKCVIKSNDCFSGHIRCNGGIRNDNTDVLFILHNA
jgi:hypothetical protein